VCGRGADGGEVPGEGGGRVLRRSAKSQMAVFVFLKRKTNIPVSKILALTSIISSYTTCRWVSKKHEYLSIDVLNA
jgi:hypothetical protein